MIGSIENSVGWVKCQWPAVMCSGDRQSLSLHLIPLILPILCVWDILPQIHFLSGFAHAAGHGWYWNQLFIDFKDRWSGRASFHDARAPGGWLPLCWVSTYPLWVCFLSYLSEALLPCGHSLGSIRAATGYPSNDNSRYHHLVPTFCFRSHSRLRRGLSHHHWVMGLGASPVPRTSH